MFDFYDLVEKRLVDVETAAGFMPLLCGAPTREQADRIYGYLNSKSFCALHQGNCFSIPNYYTQKEDFDRLNYWRGPVWININWLLMQGLRRYGYHQKADSVAKDILELPMRFGFYEYFDSLNGRGYDSSNFSWTAALRNYDLELLKTRQEGLSFWINIYNTIVVDGIIQLGIKSSVKEVMGFFSRIKYIIGGYSFSPDDIEHGILRANKRHPSRPFRQFGSFDTRKRYALEELDPRIHFALVCGSRSCAPIRFYTPQGIDRELDTAATNFINSSEVVVIPEEHRIVLSMIFKWYQKDFGGLDGVIDFIIRYFDDDKRSFLSEHRYGLTVDYLYYDWNLNK